MLQIGVSGHELTAQERDWLQHDACAGVILFARNFADRPQVTALIAELRAAAPRPLLVCVDQEGGPVQRFRAGFTALPPLAQFGRRFAVEGDAALRAAADHAWLMAAEMRAIGIDVSFAPVVDLGRGNRAIGERAFHSDPAVVAAFAQAYIDGMHAAGMAATLKHFPGHGSVREDTHHDAANDLRPWSRIDEEDLVPFRAGIAAGADAVMLAHVAYPQVDPDPAGYSRYWIQDVLRTQLGFRGIAISDDIGMAAAEAAGGVAARLRAHVDAGCDLVLACAPALVPDALAALPGVRANDAIALQLSGRPGVRDWDALLADPRRERALAALTDPELRLA